MEEKIDGNNTKMLCAFFNKSWNQHLTKQRLYVHLHPILQILYVRQDVSGTAGKLRTNSWVLADQHKLAYICSVQTLDAVRKTCQELWMIGNGAERETANTVLSGQVDDVADNA